jgi:SAM-dependent methyltransferase
MGGTMRKGLLALCEWLCRQLPPREIGFLFERLQVSLADKDPKVGHYALEFNNPQTLCFLVDAFPTLQKIFATYPRMGTVRLLDVGPAFGASGGLLSQMHRSHFLGPKVLVDALDIVDSRRKFIELSYPLVNFLHSSIENLPEDAQWDVVYCSNTIEHIDDPRAFIRSVMQHTTGWAVFLAPYREALPLSLDHRLQITEETFAGFHVESLEVIKTAAWPTTAEGVIREQILVVLKAQFSQTQTTCTIFG